MFKVKIFTSKIGQICLLLLLVFILSCSNFDIKDKIKTVDKIEIYMYDSPKIENRMERLIETITDTVGVAKVINFISWKSTPQYKCGFDGKIVFYEGNKVLQRIEYKLDDECRHFSIFYNDEIICKKITDEGVKYIKGLRVKASF